MRSTKFGTNAALKQNFYRCDIIPDSEDANYSDDESPANVAKIDSISLEGNVNTNDSSEKPCSEIVDNLDTYNPPNLEPCAQLLVKVPAPKITGTPWTIEQVDFVLESRRFGQSFYVIARMLGCKANAVCLMLQRRFGSRVLVDDDADNSHDSPKGIVKLPAIDDIVIPQYSNQIFTMNICERRVRNGQPELTQASWKCIRSVKGIVAVDQARSLVSLAAVMLYLNWDSSTLY